MRHAVRGLLLLVLLAGFACKGANPPPVSTLPAASSDATSSTTGGGAPGSVAPALADPAHRDLATAVPQDAVAVLELPEIARWLEPDSLLEGAVGSLAIGQIASEIAKPLGVKSNLVEANLKGLGRVVAFGSTKAAGVLVEVRSRGPVDKLLASSFFVSDPGEPGTAEHVVVRPRAADWLRIAWFPSVRLVLVTTDADLAHQVETLVASGGPSYATHASRPTLEPNGIGLFVDLARLAASVPEVAPILGPGSRARVEVVVGETDTRARVELTARGPRAPRWGLVLAPVVARLAPRLPEETLAFASVSTRRRAGKTVRDLLSEGARMVGESKGTTTVTELDALARRMLGLGLNELDAMLGDEIAFGGLVDPAQASNIKDAGLGALDRDAALFLAVSTRDAAAARRLIAAVGKALSSSGLARNLRISVRPGLVQGEPRTPGGVRFRIETLPDVIVVGVGAPKWTGRAIESLAKGERTLGASAAFASVAARLTTPTSGVSWLSSAGLAGLGQASSLLVDGDSSLSLGQLAPSQDGLELELAVEGVTGLAMVTGTLAAVAIYGVRRYLASAKVSEAKAAGAAIVRGVVAAFEREATGPARSAAHQLCGSAKAVPARIPEGKRYAPTAEPNRDWRTGDDARGWACLRFEMSEPHYYQYEYRQGGPYKGPSRGGPDPGPNGFEVSAEGDLDGDGRTSLFTWVGAVDRATGRLQVAPTLFIVDEFE